MKSDLGTLVLNGANTHTGGTQINGGTVRIAGDGALGGVAGGLGLDGGILQTTANLTTARAIALGYGGGSFLKDVGTWLTLQSSVDSTGGLIKDGEGTLLLEADAVYSGRTTIRAAHCN